MWMQDESRLRIINDGPPAFIWTTDAQAFVLTNRRSDETLREGWRRIAPADDVDGLLAAFLKAFEKRKPFKAEARVQDGAGWLRCEGAPRFDGDGGFLGYSGCCVDVTQAGRPEDESRRHEILGRLVRGVAHDFNNLLTVLLGNLDFLQRAAPSRDGKVERRLAAIRSAAERGARLTAQLGGFARRPALGTRPIDVNEVVLGVRDLLQSAMGGASQVETILTPDPCVVLADQTRIERALLTLALDARPAMRGGGALTIKTENAKAVRKAEPRVKVSIVLSGSDLDAPALAKTIDADWGGGQAKVEASSDDKIIVSLSLPCAPSTPS